MPPARKQRPDGLVKEWSGDWLDQVRIEPRRAGPLPILGLTIARQRDESDRRPQDGADLTADLIAVEIGEADVH